MTDALLVTLALLGVGLALVFALRAGQLARRLGALSSRHAVLSSEAERLREAERRMASIADALPVRISHFDRHERVLYANRYCGVVRGCEAAELVGKTVREVRGAESYATIKPYIERALGGELVRYEHALEVDGAVKYFQQEYIPQFGADGSVQGFVSISFEITDRRLNEQRLQHQSRHDALTGLWNRLEFDERLPEAMERSRRSGLAMALAFIDVDHFKSINDCHGHAAGDEVLRQFSARLTRSIRRVDTAARLAGDEFVVIFEGLRQPSEAQAVARKILDATREPVLHDGQAIAMSASIGLAHFGGGRCEPQSLLADADKALYAAKAAGRNTMHAMEHTAAESAHPRPA